MLVFERPTPLAPKEGTLALGGACEEEGGGRGDQRAENEILQENRREKERAGVENRGSQECLQCGMGCSSLQTDRQAGTSCL